MKLPEKRAVLSLLLKLLVIVSAVGGTYLSYAAGRESFMGGRHVFMYFTIQSNLAAALLSLIGLVLLLRKATPPAWWYTLRFVGAIAITLTGVVFAAILAPTIGRRARNLQNTLTHVVVPLAAVLDFFLLGLDHRIPRRHVVFTAIPPLAYAAYAGIGYLAGWEFARGVRYPYFFLNWDSPAGALGFSRELPFMGVLWWVLVILLLLLAAGYGYLALLDMLRKNRKDESIEQRSL